MPGNHPGVADHAPNSNGGGGGGGPGAEHRFFAFSVCGPLLVRLPGEGAG